MPVLSAPASAGATTIQVDTVVGLPDYLQFQVVIGNEIATVVGPVPVASPLELGAPLALAHTSGQRVNHYRRDEGVRGELVGDVLLDNEGLEIEEGFLDAVVEPTFPPDLHAIQIVDPLPALPDANYPTGTFVFYSVDQKLYKSLGDVWDPAVKTEDLQGQIESDQIDPAVFDQIIADSLVAGQAAFAAIAVDLIAASDISADQITSGTLVIGGVPSAGSNPETLIVYDAEGDEIGRWDQLGLTLWDIADPSRMMRFVDGRLEFSSDGFATAGTVAISGEGIWATAITIGDLPGGHNSVRNAGFEIVNRESFSTPSIKLWDVAADWGATIGTDVNVTKTGNSLTMTTATY